MKLLTLLAILPLLFSGCHEDNYGLVYKCDNTELQTPTSTGTNIPSVTLPKEVQGRISKHNFSFVKYLEFDCSGKAYILVFKNDDTRYSLHLDHEGNLRQESMIRI